VPKIAKPRANFLSSLNISYPQAVDSDWLAIPVHKASTNGF